MTPFSYARARDATEAVRLGGTTAARYLGGGTNLVDLMRETIERPTLLIDVTRLSSSIEGRDDGSLIIGAATKNTALAENHLVRERFPMLARRARRRLGADPQHGDGGRQSAATHPLHVFLR